MLNKQKNLGNILERKKQELSDFGKNIISDTKKYTAAGLIGLNILATNPVNANNTENNVNVENTENKKFEDEEIIRDKNGNILAGKNRIHESKVTDGFETIYELFYKMDQMFKTQREPGYTPQHHGEINKETGEKIPTFIIIGDIHADEYGMKENSEGMKGLIARDGHTYLIELNENANQEIEVIELLNKKFGISLFGLENESYGIGNHRTKIGRGVDELKVKNLGNSRNPGITSIGLETKSYSYSNMDEDIVLIEVCILDQLMKDKNIINNFFKDINEFLAERYNKENKTPNENNKDLNKKNKKTVHPIDNSIKANKITPEIRANYENKKLKFQRELALLKANYRFDPNTKENPGIQKINILYKTFFEGLSDHEKLLFIFDKTVFLDIHLNNLKNMEPNVLNCRKKISEGERIEIFYKALGDTFEKMFKLNNERNTIGINLMDREMKARQENIGVMVYGKGHINDLIKQLNEKYDGKVNIYVAK